MSAHIYLKMKQRFYRLGSQLLLLILLCLFVWPAGNVHAQVIATVVTNTNDSGPGSLREAILDSNIAAGPNEINFDLPEGVQTIQLQSALPAITSPVTINALGEQACATMPPSPRVVLDGAAAGDGADGFNIQPSASGTRIIGFYINRFSQDGVEISASDSVLACSIIGLDPADNAAGNAEQGVLLTGSNNIVGHFEGFAGNVVSGNINGVFIFQATAIGNIVRGNHIGTDSTGTQARGNTDKGVFVGFDAAGALIGGTNPADRNVIAGNIGTAIEFLDTGIALDGNAAVLENQVKGNFIGLDVTGGTSLPNGEEGIVLTNSSNNAIGGTDSGAANRIAFNAAQGVLITGSSTGNKILGNEIFANGGLAIDLGGDGVTANDSLDVDTGPNNLVNFPESLQAAAIENSITISGLINAGANGIYIVEFFTNEGCDATGQGDGQTFLGRSEVIADGNGLAEFAVTLAQSVTVGDGISATATEDGSAVGGPSSTSEFSACEIVVAGVDPAPVVPPPPATNAAPLTASDVVTAAEGTAVTIDVLANDSDPNGDPLTLSAVGNPSAGTAEIVDNKVVYTSPQDFDGTVQFFYSVNDGTLENTRQSDVTVLVEDVNDAPTDISLSVTVIDENTPEDSEIGTLSAVDPDADSSLTFSLVGEENDNESFSLDGTTLVLRTTPNFETKPSYTIGVQVTDNSNAIFTKDLTIQVENGNDPPEDIVLSNSTVDENQEAGAVVGTLSSVDSDLNDSHTYELQQVDREINLVFFKRTIQVPAADNNLFQINGDTLSTARLLDFEDRSLYTVAVVSTDSEGLSTVKSLQVRLNDLQPPADEPQNELSFCSGDDIVLLDNGSSRSSRKARVTITDVRISNKESDSCTVRGDMTVTSNGDTVRNIDFNGNVNARNQFRSSNIDDFSIKVAGITLLANDVEIEYNNELAGLHITKPRLRMPREFGGLSASLSVPTRLDTGGIRFGTGRINLPTIKTRSGFELDLSGRLTPTTGGFKISADGSLEIPNIGKRRTGRRGQSCGLSAGVDIFADSRGQTVMVMAAGEEYESQSLAPLLINAPQGNLVHSEATTPGALDAFRVGAVRAGIECSVGLPIGSTGLFVTALSGEVTLTSGREQVDVNITIITGKSVGRFGPLLAFDGDMSFKPRGPELDLGVAVRLLSVRVARAEASIAPRRFRGSLEVQAVFFRGGAEINIFEGRRGGRKKVFVTGSAGLKVGIEKGAAGKFLFVPVPPFSIDIASAKVEAGDFTNRTFGFKGRAKFLGIFNGGVALIIDNRRPKPVFRDLDRFQLVAAPRVAAARAALIDALQNGQLVNAASQSEITFYGDDIDALYASAGVDNASVNSASVNSASINSASINNGASGMLIRMPLHKPMVDPTMVQAADVITQVNQVQHDDVLFNLAASGPLTYTLITPQGQEVTPENFDQSETLGQTIWYTQVVSYELAETIGDDGVNSTDLVDESEANSASLLFTALSSDPVVTGVDLRIDGVPIYFDIDAQDTVWLKPLTLAPGTHTVELLKLGTDEVVRSNTVDLLAGTDYSLVSIGGASQGLALLEDDRSAPETIGKTKLRFINGATPSINMLVNGTPIFSNRDYLSATEFQLLDAGQVTIEFRDSGSNALVSEATTVDLANGGVYTFFATDDVDDTVPGFDVRILQRTDELYAPLYITVYAVDQARMNEEWTSKVEGDIENLYYGIEVVGSGSSPILGSVTVDSSAPANAVPVSWQLTSDVNPTTVTVYANPEKIEASFAITNTDGTTSTEEIPSFTGFPVAQFEITDLEELSGQMVTKEIDLSDLESDSYHIWIRADDGVSTATSAYAAAPSVMAASANQSMYGVNAVRDSLESFDPLAQLADAAPVTIDRTVDFPVDWTATVSTTFDTETNSLYIEWEPNAHPDVDNYLLHFGNAPLSVTQVITTGGSIIEFDENGEAIGDEVGFITLHDIEPDVPYFLSIEALDTESGLRVRSPEVEFSASSGSFTLTAGEPAGQIRASSVASTANVPIVPIEAGGAATLPIILNVTEQLFFPNVWLTTDLGGAAPGITAGFANDTDGFNELNGEIVTRNLEINVAASVPAGRYPIVITGYNGEKEEALTIQLEVGDVSSVPNNAPVAEEVLVDVPGATKPVVLGGSDADGDSLTFTIVTQPANGSLSGTAPNLTYTPTAGFTGTDSFTYTINDGTVDSAAATVTIKVESTPTQPASGTIFLPLVAQ